jgi:hypothetical protein
MKEQLISFETAKLAKQNGFEFEKVSVDKHHDSIQVCTQSSLQRWLREIHQIETRIWAEHYPNGTNWCCQALQWDLTLDFKTSDLIKNGTFAFGDNGEFKTYEEALEFILQEAVKMIANQHTKFKILK